MPYHVAWADNHQTIILCQADGRWTWEEYHQALDQVAHLAGSVSHRVDLISVRSPSSVQPSGFGVPHFQRAKRVIPVHVCRRVLVTSSSSSTRQSMSMMRALMNHLIKDMTIVTTLEEAYALIEQDRDQAHQTPSHAL